MSALPRVQLMGCVRQGSWWLQKYLEQLDGLDYPERLLRYAFVEGGSTDNSREVLLDWLKTKKDVFYRQIDMPKNLGPGTHLDQLRRRMWFSGNHARQLLRQDMQGVNPVDYIFICDCDVVSIPSSLLKKLVALDVDVVAPYIYVKPPEGQEPKIFFDTWAFRWISRKPDPETGLLPMNSVGACPVLIKAEVVKAVDYWGKEAIVGFCKEAREKGFKIWSYPEMHCLHRRR